MTEKLYYLDSHMKTFTAKVVSCTEAKGGYHIILDKTAFYPEGGGQPADHGTLGGVNVLDVKEQAEQVVHICDAPLAEGASVEGIIDWERRLHLMQQHSGEHILSGFLHAATGCDNVGFHMGADCVTIDFNVPLTQEQIMEAEAKTNRYIWENHPIITSFPPKEELETLPYRSKKELTGQVRIVEFPGADLCACCGVHVKYTGQIGMVKILSCQKFHEGVRLEMLAGSAAMEYLSRSFAENKKVSGLLSAKPFETAAATERMSKELSDTKFKLGKLEDQLFALKADAMADTGDVLLFEEGLSPDGVRRLTDAVFKVCGGSAAVFGKTQAGYQYAIASNEDIRDFVKQMNSALSGRGGGKPNFCQGSVTATEAGIREFFKK